MSTYIITLFKVLIRLLTKSHGPLSSLPFRVLQPYLLPTYQVPRPSKCRGPAMPQRRHWWNTAFEDDKALSVNPLKATCGSTATSKKF